MLFAVPTSTTERHGLQSEQFVPAENSGNREIPIDPFWHNLFIASRTKQPSNVQQLLQNCTSHRKTFGVVYNMLALNLDDKKWHTRRR